MGRAGDYGIDGASCGGSGAVDRGKNGLHIGAAQEVQNL